MAHGLRRSLQLIRFEDARNAMRDLKKYGAGSVVWNACGGAALPPTAKRRQYRRKGETLRKTIPSLHHIEQTLTSVRESKATTVSRHDVSLGGPLSDPGTQRCFDAGLGAQGGLQHISRNQRARLAHLA
ncbi:MAG: hypothetical protein M1837_007387 [Sclerophora amabilis]|nr:MAG: hypothetical protein M1837_007387 [Sclerophora amabilis]